MIKYIIVAVVALCVGSAATWYFGQTQQRAMQQSGSVGQVVRLKAMIAHGIEREDGLLRRQLSGFTRAVSADREFSMKLFVDSDRLAPEVSEISQMYMEAMDFDLLTVADSASVTLSCGHFPGATGRIVSSIGVTESNHGRFLFDELHDDKALTFQMRVPFSIAETPLSAIGGRVVDKEFLRGLAADPMVHLILQYGDYRLGSDKVSMLSPYKDHCMMLNDTAFFADTLLLPTGTSDTAVLYVLYGLAPKVTSK